MLLLTSIHDCLFIHNWLQARQDAAKFAATRLETLSDKTKTPTSQLKFITDAWGQVGLMPCQRALQFVHAPLLYKACWPLLGPAAARALAQDGAFGVAVLLH